MCWHRAEPRAPHALRPRGGPALLVINSDDKSVSQREYPRMACIVPDLTEIEIQVRGLGVPLLRISLDQNRARVRRTVTIGSDCQPALDEGNAAAQWFSQAIGTQVRLIRFDDSVQRRVSADRRRCVHAVCRRLFAACDGRGVAHGTE